MSALCKVLPKVLDKVFSKAFGGLSPPANSQFFWPFGDETLDESLEGADATYTDGTDNLPTYDGGIVLDSTDSPEATAPVSTSQVDSVRTGFDASSDADLISAE